MLPRGTCPRCRRSITVNKDGQMRSHFCPHFEICERAGCLQCAVARASADPDPRDTPQLLENA
jgi:hypothetical protein